MGWAGWTKSREALSAGDPEFQTKKIQVITIHNYLCCTGVFCKWVKHLTDLQILGCELRKNASGGRAPPGPAGGATALPQDPKPL